MNFLKTESREGGERRGGEEGAREREGETKYEMLLNMANMVLLKG